MAEVEENRRSVTTNPIVNGTQRKYIPTFDVFVANLPENATEKTLSKLFTCYGEIQSVTVRESRRCDGRKIGFVKYHCEPDADLAVKERSGHMWDGMPLLVRRAEDRGRFDRTGNMPYDVQAQQRRPDAGSERFTARKGTFANSTSQQESLMVTHVEDPCTFWAQNESQSDEIDKLTQNLNQHCSQAPPVQGKPIQHEVYATIYNVDGEWYRCAHMQHIPDDKSLVKYIDWGNAEIVENSKIVVVSEVLAKILPMAQRYRLNRTMPNPGDQGMFKKGVEFLKEVTDNQVLQCRIYRSDFFKSYTFVEVMVNGIRLEEAVIERGYATRYQRFQSPNEGGVPNFSFVPNTVSNKPLQTNTRFMKSSLPIHPIRGSHVGNTASSPTRAVLGNQPVEQRVPFRAENQWYHQSSFSEGRVQGVVQGLVAMQEVISLRKDFNQYQNKCQQTLPTPYNKEKISEIVLLLKQVRQLRVQFPFENEESPDMLEVTAKLLLDENARLLPQNLLHLPGVKQARNLYSSFQHAIKECTEHDKLPTLLSSRDEARLALLEALVAFLNETHSLPVVERTTTLNKIVNDLNLSFGNYLKVKTSGSLPLHSLTEAYKDWKERNMPAFVHARLETNKYHSYYTEALKRLAEATSLTLSADSPPPPDLPSVLDGLEIALKAELRACNVEDSQGLAVVAMLIQKLHVELTQERDYVLHLKTLQDEYTLLEAELRPLADRKPDSHRLNQVRKTIKSLKSRLRHKLADQHDLEEENEVDPTALNTVKSELSKIRNDLQSAFAQEDAAMAELSKLVSTYYPELAVLHPELLVEVEHQGLVKQGRDLDQFDVQPFTQDESVMLASDRGTNVVLREFVLDGTTSKTNFIKRVKQYSSVKCEQLVPVDAVFFSKGDKQVYVQTPHYPANLYETLSNGVLSNEIQSSIVQDLLEGLQALHSIGIVHGCINPWKIMVTSSGRALISPFNFNVSAIQRAEGNTNYLKGLQFLAPEHRNHSMQESFCTDMFSLGIVLLLMQNSHFTFSLNQDGVPNIPEQMQYPLSALVQKLIRITPYERLHAKYVLMTPQLLDPQPTNYFPIGNFEEMVNTETAAAENVVPDENTDVIGSLEDSAISNQCTSVDEWPIIGEYSTANEPCRIDTLSTEPNQHPSVDEWPVVGDYTSPSDSSGIGTLSSLSKQCPGVNEWPGVGDYSAGGEPCLSTVSNQSSGIDQWPVVGDYSIANDTCETDELSTLAKQCPSSDEWPCVREYSNVSDSCGVNNVNSNYSTDSHSEQVGDGASANCLPCAIIADTESDPKLEVFDEVVV